MRILLVTPNYPPPYGGIQTLVANLEEGIERLGHESIILQSNPKDCNYQWGDFIPSRNIVSKYNLRSLYLIPFFNSTYREAKKAIKEYSPDVVHALHIREWPALVAAKGFDIPTVVSTHAAELSEKQIVKTAITTSDAVHSVSKFTGSLINRDHNVESDAIIHPSIDLKYYQPDPGKETYSGCVFSISRFVERKNLGTIIDAWQMIGDKIKTNRNLVIAGDGPLRRSIESKTENMPNVTILGRIEEYEKRDWLQQSDLFVLPASGSGYNVEGFGIVFIEAQAAGTPVIGSSIGGVPEAIGDAGINLDDENDHVELSQKIEKLLTDNNTRNRYLRAAEERIPNFDLEPIAEEYLEVYRRI